ncbi:hypothetical protein Bca4012_003712 [Brassica carinata]
MLLKLKPLLQCYCRRTITVELPPDWVDVSEEISACKGLSWERLGTIVDRIDNNIHNVSSTVEDGTQTAAKETYTEKWRYGYVCVCACHSLLHQASALNRKGDFLVTQEKGLCLN